MLYPFLNRNFDKFLLGHVFLRLTEFRMSCLDFRLAFNNFGTI